MSRARYALPVGSGGWWVYSSPSHPFEGWKPAKDYSEYGEKADYGCLLCGGDVGPEESDYCPNEQCKEVFKQYKLLLALEVPPSKNSGHRFGLDPVILDMTWKKVRDLFIEVNPDDEY